MLGLYIWCILLIVILIALVPFKVLLALVAYYVILIVIANKRDRKRRGW